MRCSVAFGVMLRLLVINISSSSSAINSATYYQGCVITCEMVALVWNIAMPFGIEKLERCGYPIVKNFDATFIRFDTIHERDRQTDRHRVTA